MYMFRDILTVCLVENSTKVGGAGETVEIDECGFGKIQYNSGPLTKIRSPLFRGYKNNLSRIKKEQAGKLMATAPSSIFNTQVLI